MTDLGFVGHCGIMHRRERGIWRRLVLIAAVAIGGFGRAALPIIFARVAGNRDLSHRLFGEVLADSAERLGPVFIKLAQMVSYRADLLPDALRAPLARLQEQVAPVGPGEARRALELALGHSADLLFAQFDDNPIACGSIASVHIARTHAGDVVAVKIVRLAAPETIRRDLACARWVTRRIANSRYASGIPVAEIFETIASMIAAQSDMIAEAQNLQNFSRNTSAHQDVRLPTPRSDIAVAHGALIMDYVGNTCSIASPALSDQEFRAAAVRVLRRLYRMLFADGLIHCDLHPGNVHVQADGTAWLFDAGLVSEMSRKDREYFRDFFVAFTNGDAAKATASIINSAVDVPHGLDRNRLQSDVGLLLTTYAGRRAGEFLVVDFVGRLFAIQRKHRLYGSPGFVSAIWALVMFEGLVRHRYPDLDFQGEARAFAIASILHGVRRVVGIESRNLLQSDDRSPARSPTY
jgi:ubiquinone biosynthesis protein